jgi:hypothetical protein
LLLFKAGGSLLAMPKSEKLNDEPGAWIFRDVPRDLMRRAKAGAALQGKSVRALAIELMEAHLQELERKGILSRGK